MKYAEKALEVLSEMENANVLGHLLAHIDVLSMALAPKPDTHFTYIKAIKGFDGDITETMLDPHINRHRSPIKEQDKRKDALKRRKRQCHTHTTIFPLHMRKQRFRCGHFGHIRSHCPRHTPPLGLQPPPLMTAIVITCASLADCWLISDLSDYPTMYNLATTLFTSDICPHYLVIYLPSITICVCLLSDVFLSHHTLAMPPMIKPPSGLCCYI